MMKVVWVMDDEVCGVDDEDEGDADDEDEGDDALECVVLMMKMKEKVR